MIGLHAAATDDQVRARLDELLEYSRSFPKRFPPSMVSASATGLRQLEAGATAWRACWPEILPADRDELMAGIVTLTVTGLLDVGNLGTRKGELTPDRGRSYIDRADRGRRPVEDGPDRIS